MIHVCKGCGLSCTPQDPFAPHKSVRTPPVTILRHTKFYTNSTTPTAREGGRNGQMIPILRSLGEGNTIWCIPSLVGTIENPGSTSSKGDKVTCCVLGLISSKEGLHQLHKSAPIWRRKEIKSQMCKGFLHSRDKWKRDCRINRCQFDIWLTSYTLKTSMLVEKGDSI